LRMAPPIEPFSKQNRGMILSEGAGAIVLARDGFVTIERVHAGGHFSKRAETEKILKRILCDLGQVEIDFVVSSANGTFVDQAESQALQEIVPNALVYTITPALGESVGAAGLWQVILAAHALQSKEVPPVLHADHSVRLRLSFSRTPIPSARRAIVLSCGLNQQAAGLRLAIR
jgi:3-oxoacyl-(acyl-carrier-protein) synthase